MSSSSVQSFFFFLGYLTLEDYDTRILTDNGNYPPNGTSCPRLKQHHCRNLTSHKKKKERKKEIAYWENTNKDHEETGCEDEDGLTSGPGTRMRVATDGPKILRSTRKVYWLLLIKQWHYFLLVYSNCTFDANRWSTSCNSCQRILNLDQLP